MEGRLRIEVRYDNERDYRLLAVGCDLDRLSLLAADVVRLSGISDIRLSITDEPHEYQQYVL